jgi:monoamine oxidase
MTHSIVIIGAGAAGLMAARLLAAAGQLVTVLEARDRIGGRVHTIQPTGFDKPIEAGAEFIHGKLPVTLQLLKEAGMTYHAVEGKMWRVKNGHWSEQSAFALGWDELMQRMQALQEDMPLADFLQQYFSGEQYKALRASVQRFAEGFDLADTTRASTLALRDEWMHEQDEQYRIPAGYLPLMQYLHDEAVKKGCLVHTSCIVQTIRWKRDQVQVITTDGQAFMANKVIVTVPIAVLQSGAIAFEPAIGQAARAIQTIGYGSVIKINLQFNNAFWNDHKNDIGFILSEETVPTWWTYLPDTRPMLTGWLGGPQAAQWYDAGEETILQQALQSLAAIFKESTSELQSKLTAWHVANWHKDRFAQGAYSYSIPGTSDARKQLKEPIDQTIFFAGEGIYDEHDGGTVEAALVTAQELAGRLS